MKLFFHRFFFFPRVCVCNAESNCIVLKLTVSIDLRQYFPMSILKRQTLVLSYAEINSLCTKRHTKGSIREQDVKYFLGPPDATGLFPV